MPSHPSPRGSNFRRFFDVRRRKNGDNLGFSVARKNCVFSDGPKLLLRKIPKKVTFLGNFPEYIFHHLSFSWLCFYTVLSGRSTTSAGVSEKIAFFRTEKMTFFRASEKMLFFHPTAPGWRSEKILVIWLAGYLAGWLAIWLAGWLSRWLVGHLAGCLAGYLAGWLFGWLSGWLALWLAACLFGY